MNAALKKHLKMPVAATCFAVVLEIQAWGLTGGSSQVGEAPAYLLGDATDAHGSAGGAAKSIWWGGPDGAVGDSSSWSGVT